MGSRTKRLEKALETEKHKRSFYGYLHRAPEQSTIDAILEAQIEMSRLLDTLMPDRSDDV